MCQVMGGILGAVFIDKLGRKPVLQAGAWLMLLGNILLSLYFSTLGEDRQCPTSPGSALCWTPAIATCVFFLGFGSGLGNVLFVLMAEVVPVQKQSQIIPMVTFFLNFLQFSLIKLFLYFVQVIGLTNIFFLQAGLNLCALLGQAAFVPETRVVPSPIVSLDPNRYNQTNSSSRHKNNSYGTFFK